MPRILERLEQNGSDLSQPGGARKGHAQDTKKAKVASCPGTRQKPSLEAPFWLFWALEAQGALFDQIQAQILGSLCLQKSWGFRLKRKSVALQAKMLMRATTATSRSS